MNSELLNNALKRRFTTAVYSKVKFTPDRKQKRVQMYSSAGEWNYSVLLLCVEKPPVAVVVIE